jgi:hypothetical protein
MDIMDSTNENTPSPHCVMPMKKETTAGSQADVYAQHEIIANNLLI